MDADVDRRLNGVAWIQSSASPDAPSCLVLDGPNPFVREAPDKPPKVYVGTGATQFDLGLLEKFFADIVVDERFTASVLVPARGTAGPEDVHVFEQAF